MFDRHAEGWLDLGPGWLFAAIRDAVVVADAASSEIALWNPAASDLFGYQSAEVLGKPLHDLVIDLEQTPQWQAACAGADDRHVVELFARRKHGADVCVELSLSRQTSPSHDRAFVVAVIRDVSERRQADEDRLERMREQLAMDESDAAQRPPAVLAE